MRRLLFNDINNNVVIIKRQMSSVERNPPKAQMKKTTIVMMGQPSTMQIQPSTQSVLTRLAEIHRGKNTAKTTQAILVRGTYQGQ